MIKVILSKVNLDALGISASVICAIHCAVLPLFFTSLPLFGIEILHSKFFEYSMIVFAAIVGSYALSHGLKKHHHKKLPLVIFCTGLLFLVMKDIFVSKELLLLIPAATCIIGAHILNFRFYKRALIECNHQHSLH